MLFDFLRGINSKCRVGLEFFLAVLCLCTRLTDRSGEVRKCANLLVATPAAGGDIAFPPRECEWRRFAAPQTHDW